MSFLICVEANRLEPQAMLLCESIRRFGGRYAQIPIVAVSPRPELALGRDARRRLAELDVAYVVEPLNRTGHSYGTINRIVAGAWAEQVLESEFIVVLDTDMVFTGEPSFVDADVGVRPVDAKGSASAGEGDPLDDYWGRLCAFAGIGLDRIPFLETTLNRVRIRASYNGGFSVLRRSRKILQKTHDIFFEALAACLRPRTDTNINLRASTGMVGLEAAQMWGSSQAALSVAVWSTTTDVRIYDHRYNIPLHGLDLPGEWPVDPEAPAILVHYHHLGEPHYHREFRSALKVAGCSPDAAEWVMRGLSVFQGRPAALAL